MYLVKRNAEVASRFRLRVTGVECGRHEKPTQLSKGPVTRAMLFFPIVTGKASDFTYIGVDGIVEHE